MSYQNFNVSVYCPVSNINKITDFEGFRTSLYATNEKFPTPEKSIEEIYLIDWEEPSYIKFANMAEEVLKNDSYKLSREQLKGYRATYAGMTGLIKSLSRCDLLYKPYMKLLKNENLKWSFIERQRQIREGVYRIEQEHSHELTSVGEVEGIINRIANALEQ